MKEMFLVFIGSGIGGITRFSLGNWIDSLHKLNFPLGTLAVNIIACFSLGLIIGIADQKQLLSISTKLFFTVGFCGGFSTFSTFSQESFILLNQNHYLSFILNVSGSFFLCICAIYLGQFIASII